MIEVVLTDYELRLAAGVGEARQIEALLQGRPNVAGFDGIGWDVHIEGAMGELAVAKATGRYWSGSFNTFKEGGDVGQLQVRTRSRHDYDLLIRPNDPDDAVFVLVTGVAPRFRVHGWIVGKEAKCDEFLQTHGGRPAAYFVPQRYLSPINPREAQAA